jgi:hypothetical protein
MEKAVQFKIPVIPAFCSKELGYLRSIYKLKKKYNLADFSENS